MNDFRKKTTSKKFTEMQAETQEQLLHSEKLAILGQLVAGFAHEIKNPLAAINAYISAIKKQIASSDNYRLKAALEGLDQATDHLNYTVSNFVNFSRKTQEDKVEINIADIINSAISLSNSHVTDHDVDIQISIAENLPKIIGFPNQLVQVFLNLIINAVHAINKERGLIKINAQATNGDKYIQISISDNGSGIKKEIIGQIFDAFFTTKDITTGTGLGLSISYGIIEKHHGYIDVESEEGQGTTFTIKLPTTNNISIDPSN